MSRSFRLLLSYRGLGKMSTLFWKIFKNFIHLIQQKCLGLHYLVQLFGFSVLLLATRPEEPHDYNIGGKD